MKLIKYIPSEATKRKVYSPLNAFFQKIFYINMDIATERNQKIIELFKNYNIEAERFPGIVPNDRGIYREVGTRGCFESHFEIIKKAKSEKLNNVLIFEDDIDFYPEYKNNINPILEQLKKENYDIIYFGICGGRRIQREEHNQYFDRLKFCWCNHAYGINNTAYDKLINLLSNNYNGEAVDNLYTKIFDKINVLVSKPQLVHQISGYSFIKNKHRNW